MNRSQDVRDDRVSLVEMGPRDGLQNEAAPLSLVQRLELIQRLTDSGLQRIEVGAFVSAKKVPQMADSAALFEALPRKGSTRYGALVPNLQGLQAAIAARADEIGLFTACSDGFTRANIGISVEESLVRFAPLVQEARRLGIKVRGYLSTVIACPFDGPTRPKRVAAMAEQLLDLGCHEISLGDTIGVGTLVRWRPCWMRYCTRSRRGDSRSIFTTPTARVWPTCCPRWSAAFAPSTARWQALAAVPMRRAPPAMWRQKRWSTCCTALA